MGSKVVMGLIFFPRGGSAQVARYLARSLADDGWDATVATGSLGAPGEESNAETFYRDVNVCALDYTQAAAAADPLAADPPFQPSFEDRPGRRTGSHHVDDDDYERMVAVWEQQLERAGAGEADVLISSSDAHQRGRRAPLSRRSSALPPDRHRV